MRRMIVLVAVGAILIAGSALGAQQQPGANCQHLKFFDAYMGTWVWHGRLDEDFPFGKKGEIGTGSISWKWAYEGSAVEWEWKFRFGGKRSGTKGIITWDPILGRAVGSGVSSDGVMIHVTVRSTEPMTIFVESVEPDGAKSSQVETFALPSQDTMVIRNTERKGGPVTEDSAEYTFTRATQDVGPNYEHLKPLEWVIGEWELEDALLQDVPGMGKKGDPLILTIHWAWGAQKNTIHQEMTGVVKGRPVWAAENIWGWDAGNKQIVSFGFETRGGQAEGVVTVTADTVEVANQTVSPDGVSGTATTTIKRIDRDTFGGETTDISVGGAAQPDLPYREFKRTKK